MRILSVLLFLVFLSAPTAQALAQDCTSPDGDIGVIKYNTDYGVFQICTAKNWIGLNPIVCPAGDRCAGTADAFSFTDLTDVAKSTLIESNIIQISGLTGTGGVSITGDGTPNFRICSASDCSAEITTWGSSPQDINTGDYLQLRLTSSASDSTLHSATVTVNGTSDQWDVTTGIPITCENGPIGTVCDSDGAIYAGIWNGVRIYVAPESEQNGGFSGFEWGGWGKNDDADSYSDGFVNTNNLISDAHIHPAAEVCRSERGASWYLPASSELAIVYSYRNIIDGSANSSFGNSDYWSSTEFGTVNARFHDFANGEQDYKDKRFNARVRCIRR